MMNLINNAAFTRVDVSESKLNAEVAEFHPNTVQLTAGQQLLSQLNNINNEMRNIKFQIDNILTPQLIRLKNKQLIYLSENNIKYYQIQEQHTMIIQQINSYQYEYERLQQNLKITQQQYDKFEIIEKNVQLFKDLRFQHTKIKTLADPAIIYLCKIAKDVKNEITNGIINGIKFNLCYKQILKELSEEHQVLNINLKKLETIFDAIGTHPLLIQRFLELLEKPSNAELDKVYEDDFFYFPDDIIGKIASFLSLFDYITFQITNKRIYNVSCNPYTLNTLNLNESGMLRYSLKYIKISNLSIDITKMYNSWTIQTNPIYNNVKILTLNCNDETSQHQLSHILLSGLINFISVDTLIINHLHINWKDFGQFLFLFPNVHSLWLHSFTLYHQENDQDDDDEDDRFDELQTLFPKLRALKITGGCNRNFCDEMVKIYGNNLYSLSFDDDSINIPISEEFNSKITELRAPCISLMGILKKTYNISRIYIYGTKSCPRDETKKLMNNIITKQLDLEYLGISVDDEYQFRNVLDDIITELIDSRDQKREKGLKISYNIAMIQNIQEIKTNITKIVTALEYYTRNDWMLILYGRKRAKMTQNLLESSYRNKYNVYQKYSNRHNTLRVIITNKQCKINGYQQKWLL